MNERAVSTPLGYALILSMTAILLIGLATGSGTIVNDQKETASTSEMEIAGNLIASEIETVDKTFNTETNSIEINTQAPDRIVGEQYRVEIEERGSNSGTLIITHFTVDKTIEIPFRVQNNIDDGATVDSGNIIVTTNEDGEITLTDE